MTQYAIYGLILIAGIVIGACVPKVAAFVQRELINVKAKAVSDVAAARAEAETVKLKALDDLAKAKADVDAELASLKARAEAAEADLAALKRFLPGVVASASAPAPAAPSPAFTSPLATVPQA